MSAGELQELEENAEKGHHNRGMAPVSLTMAVLAVLVAAVALLGHRAHTEELVLQTKSTDQWAHYQAKKNRQHSDEFFVDLTSVTPTTDPAALSKFREKYSQEAERYNGELKEIEAEARKLEDEVSTERNRADRFDLAEVFLEIGLVITSITLMSGRRLFWHLGIVLAVVGVAVAGTAFVAH